MKKDSWIAYKDSIGNKKMLVRVDKSYENSVLKHTYILSYNYKGTRELPSVFETRKIYRKEDKINKIVRDVFEDNVVYLGTASFGGKFYLVFASDLDIKWKEFVNCNIYAEDSYVYLNDNMNYYHKILLPKEIKD